MNKSNKDLTDKQRRVLEFITDTVQKESRMPSYREIAKAMQVSAVGTIQDHVRALISQGCLTQNHVSGRTILSLSENRQAKSVSVPILGKVAAGSLHDAFEVSLGTLSLSMGPKSQQKNLKPGQVIALQVTGDSMIDAGIFEGDYVMIDRLAKIKSGDFVVVDVAGQCTVKEVRFPKKASEPTLLIPHNPRLKPMELDSRDESKAGRTQMIGKVISVQRFLT